MRRPRGLSFEALKQIEQRALKRLDANVAVGERHGGLLGCVGLHAEHLLADELAAGRAEGCQVHATVTNERTN